ncbi:phytanoyl-CoA dioxygenase family protein [Pseudomonas sp. MIACH]|uniref:phytanoyl-CoA dioxygenase family protein n=1 Tax=Pseudomonas sp. MIACH TaxID=1078355 RepID=UPI0009EB6863|nr:phytanoyl-CoA dioxygenase family protein [Pseudomonas sp. MIACH]
MRVPMLYNDNKKGLQLMNISSPISNQPPMRELNVSNDLLDDRQALNAAWERDGYWFFRDVLDQASVSRLRGVYMDLLDELGVTQKDDAEALYSGKSLEGFPFRMEPLVEREIWRPFVQEPPIHAFFQRLLDDQPFWIPTVEYRATPPTAERKPSRLDYLHQDGFYNVGIPFLICWIPLSVISDEIGGLVLAEGMHKGPYLHDVNTPPLFPIPNGSVPDHAWRRTTYRPGDVLLMHINTPHSGLANYSDRFRLSMDIRIMGASGHTPIIGTLTALSSSSVSVVGDDGRTGTFVVDTQTYCRGIDGKKVPLDEIPQRMKAGDSAIVAFSDGHATLIRPPH